MLYDALHTPSLRPHRPIIGPSAQKRVVFGQTIYWEEFETNKRASTTARHLTEETLESYRGIGDPELDDILEAYAVEGRPIGPGTGLLLPTTPKSVAELKLHAFLQTYRSSPPFDIDMEQLQRGQDVFLHYLPAISLSLYYRCLVPGFSIPKIAKVLQSTGYLAPPSNRERVGERLMDTGAFLAGIFGTDVATSLMPSGKAWEMCLQVRLLHAKVRRALMKSKKWDLKEYGVPINQEDMAATLLAFSINSLAGVEIVLMGLVAISDQERRDYLALWRYIGWLLGVHVTDPLSNLSLRPLDPCGPGWIEDNANAVQHSYAIFESIILHLMKPDASSVEISRHLLSVGGPKEALTDSKGEDVWFYRRAFQCRRFVGDPLADALLFPLRKTWWGRWDIYSWTTLRMIFVTVYTIGGLPWSPFRGLIRWFHRKQLGRVLTYWEVDHPKRNRKRLDKQSTCPFAMVSSPVN